MEPGARDVQVASVGRHHGPCALQHLPVANRAVPDAHRPGRRPELPGSDGARARHEHLAPPRVDHGQHALPAGRERVERGDARSRDLERERQAACGGEPDAGAREAAGAGTDDDALQRCGLQPCVTQQPVDVDEQRDGTRRPLAEHLAVIDERAGGDASRGVEREDQHARVLLAAPVRPRRGEPAGVPGRRGRAQP